MKEPHPTRSAIYWRTHKKEIQKRRLKHHFEKHLKQYGFWKDRIENSKRSALLSNREELSYVAGIFDGEGTFSLGARVPRLKRPRDGYKRYVPYLDISNTDRKLIDYCQKVLTKEGIDARVRLVRERGNRRDSYELFINGMDDILKTLTILRPFIISKRNHADLLMEYCYNRLMIGRRPFSYTVRDIEIAEEIRRLNTRGRLGKSDGQT